MARAPFYVFKRPKKNGYIYRAKFYTPEGKIITTVTFPQAEVKTQKAAVLAAGELLKKGLIANRQNPDALTYMSEFWTRSSKYAKMKALREQPLSDQYLYINQRILKKHAEGFLAGKKMNDLTRKVLEDIALELASKGITGRVINQVIQAIRVPYRYFVQEFELPDRCLHFGKIPEHPRARGILTLEEFRRVSAVRLSDPRIHAAIVLGGFCGLRMGEIRGLRWDSVDAKRRVIRIERNYVEVSEGEKLPKWQKTRSVPLPNQVLDAILECRNFVAGEKDYILWNAAFPDRPVNDGTIRDGFKKVLCMVGLSLDEQRVRNLCMHGLRHLFISLARSEGLPDYLVMKMAGHSSIEMTNRYSDHDELIDFNDARRRIEARVNNGADAIDEGKASGVRKAF